MATIKRFEDLECWQAARELTKYVAYDQEYIDDNELEEVKRLADIAWKKINNFISYLNKSSKKEKKGH
jgi:hypothetical protein